MLIKQRRTRDPLLRQDHLPSPSGSPGDSPDPVSSAPLPELSRRGVVDLEIAFLSSRGAQPYRDPGFGVTVAWNVDLLAGYRWILLATETAGRQGRLAAFREQLAAPAGHRGAARHADPETLLAVAACRILRVPSCSRRITSRVRRRWLAPDRPAPTGNLRYTGRGGCPADRPA